MDKLFADVVFWHWWAFAAVLMTVEIVAPSTFFMWMSMAAAVTGIFLLAFNDLSWQIQILLFSGLSILSIISGKLYLKRNPIQTDDPRLNRRAEQHVGKTYTLQSAIENGSGKVKVGDSLWRVEGKDMAAGEKVIVVSVNGNSFVVEAAG